MSKNLSERISAAVIKTKATKQGVKLAEFLALRSEIKTAIEDGWPLSTVWKTLHDEGKITFSYHVLWRLINRHGLSKSDPAQQNAPMVAASQPERTKEAKPKQPKRTAVQSGFTFNPTPNKEELL